MKITTYKLVTLTGILLIVGIATLVFLFAAKEFHNLIASVGWHDVASMGWHDMCSVGRVN